MSRARVAWPVAVLLALMAVASCSDNRKGTLLLPTGPRPTPEHPGGGLYGRILYDPSVFPDLGSPPFPATVVTLLRGNETLAVTTIPTNTDTFRFDDLLAGNYRVKVRSRVFRPDSIRALRVLESERLVDDLKLSVNLDSLQIVSLTIMGQMPDFDSLGFVTGETSMLGLNLGVWTYPNDFATPRPIPAGTYRFKFVNDPTPAAGTRGWGGDSTRVLTAPVVNAPVVFGEGPARDIKMTFPTTGVYTFSLDERRQVFSAQLAPPMNPHAARRSR